MNIQFNEAQLSRAQQKSLIEILDVLQSKNELELIVSPVEFPIKLKVMLDDNIEMLLGWDVDKQSYAGLTTPEPEKSGSQNLTSNSAGSQTLDLIPEPEPEPETKPEPELDLSPVVVRVHALGRAFVNLIKPLNTNQRLELWIEFCKILFKELLENEVS